MFSPPPCFRLILTFCYCFYGFFRELDIASGRLPDRNKVDPFHAPTRWAKLYNFAPDIQDAMGLRAPGPHAIFVKVIYTGSRRKFPSDLALCGLHDFLRLNVADIHEGKSVKVSRIVSVSPLMLDMTVMSTSGVLGSPPEVPVRNVLPLATVVSIMDAASTDTPFVVPPAPGIERPVMQAQDFSTCPLSRSREFLSLFRLSASSPAPTLPRDSEKDSSPSLSLDRVQPLRGNTSPPAGEALLQPPADDCVGSGFGDPNTAAWCEQYPGTESLWSLPGCATVRALLSSGPSGASDWVGFEDLYHTAGGIIVLCNSRSPGEGRVIIVWTAELSVQILGVRQSAVYRWKPGIWIAATSYSVPGQRRMSGVVPAPVSACRSCLDYECCSGGIYVTPE